MLLKSFYYLPGDVLLIFQKIFGVSVHPKYGGWFALRGVLIFKNIFCPDLPKYDPLDVIPTMEGRKDLLDKFNTNWQDWTFRDVIKTEDKYCEEQKNYYATPPAQRIQFLQKITDNSEEYVHDQ